MNFKTIYNHWWNEDEEFAALDQPLQPRDPHTLFDLIAPEIGSNCVALDVGCGQGKQAAKLAERCTVFGIDPQVPLVTPANFTFVKGSIQALPFPDSSFDLILSRAMLMHVSDLDQAMLECARVLKRGGSMLTLTMFATDTLEQGEAARLYRRLSIDAKSMDRETVEKAFEAAGLSTHFTEDLTSEFVEYYEEENHSASKEITRLMRLRRKWDFFITTWGIDKCEIGLGMFEWTLFQALGKITSVVYKLKK